MAWLFPYFPSEPERPQPESQGFSADQKMLLLFQGLRKMREVEVAIFFFHQTDHVVLPGQGPA